MDQGPIVPPVICPLCGETLLYVGVEHTADALAWPPAPVRYSCSAHGIFYYGLDHTLRLADPRRAAKLRREDLS